MSDVRNTPGASSCARWARGKRAKNAAAQAAAGLDPAVAGHFTATSGYGESVGPANALCATVVLLGGLALCVQAMLVVRALLAQYEHFAMPAEEAAFSLYEFLCRALLLAGARMLLLALGAGVLAMWRWRPFSLTAPSRGSRP